MRTLPYLITALSASVLACSNAQNAIVGTDAGATDTLTQDASPQDATDTGGGEAPGDTTAPDDTTSDGSDTTQLADSDAPADSEGPADSADAADVPDVQTGWVPPEPTCASPSGAAAWQVLSFCHDGAWLSVNGTAWYDVWLVGAKGQALRFDGCAYEAIPTGTTKTLWWVNPQAGGAIWAVGEAGTALRYSQAASAFEPTVTGTSATLYGVWGPTKTGHTYAVGFDPKTASDPSGVVLRTAASPEGATWEPVALPAASDKPAPFKIAGLGDDVWIVGRNDLVWRLASDGSLESLPTGAGADANWVTVAMRPNGEPVLVGGMSNAIIAMRDKGAWTVSRPDGLPALQGVCFGLDGKGLASGMSSTFVRFDGSTWAEDADAPFDLFNPFDPPVPGCETNSPDYHGCYVDSLGQAWAVGGNFFTLSFGAVLHFGGSAPTPP